MGVTHGKAPEQFGMGVETEHKRPEFTPNDRAAPTKESCFKVIKLQARCYGVCFDNKIRFWTSTMGLLTHWYSPNLPIYKKVL